jgi:hypothetical protein
VVDARTGTPRLAVAGGCGSSGTTLLAHLLGRHSRVVSSPELDFFNHPESLSVAALAEALHPLFARRRLSNGYKLVVDFCKPGVELGVDRALLSTWLAAAGSVSDVYAKLAAHVCRAKGASWYFEKTPTNVYSFRGLTEAAPEVPLIHQIRDGRDVVASLRRRGKSLFHAASRWIYDTAAGLAASRHASYRELRYEALVSDPRATLTTVLGWLGLEFEEPMLDVAENDGSASYSERWRERDAPKRWNSVPTDPISSRSVGSFRREISSDDLSMVLRVRLTERAAEELAAPVRTFGEMIELLGYDVVAVSAGGPMTRMRETTAEIVDSIERARRSLRYTGRLATPVTYVGVPTPAEPLPEHPSSD